MKLMHAKSCGQKVDTFPDFEPSVDVDIDLHSTLMECHLAYQTLLSITIV